jgi:hypothetical protein
LAKHDSNIFPAFKKYLECSVREYIPYCTGLLLTAINMKPVYVSAVKHSISTNHDSIVWLGERIDYKLPYRSASKLVIGKTTN